MKTLNVVSNSSDPRGRDLSNFSLSPFVLDNIWCASVEGFIQGVKYAEGDPQRTKAFGMYGVEAKRMGRGAERKFVWWKGVAIPYGSKEHHKLVERAIRAKFEQNQKASDSLLATGNLELTHDTGHPESPDTCLPAAVFCGILTRIREENRAVPI